MSGLFDPIKSRVPAKGLVFEPPANKAPLPNAFEAAPPTKENTVESGQEVRFITHNGRVIPITEATGGKSAHMVRRPGSGLLYDPKTSEPFRTDPRSPKGIRSAFDFAPPVPDGMGRLVKKVGDQTMDAGEDPKWAAKMEGEASKTKATSEKAAAKQQADQQKAAETDLKERQTAERVKIGQSKSELEQTDRERRLSTQNARRKVAMVEEEMRTDKRRLKEIEDELEAASGDLEKSAALQAKKAEITTLLPAKQKRRDELQLNAQKAALREEAWQRRSVKQKGELDRAKMDVDTWKVETLTNTGRRASQESDTGINAPAPDAPPPPPAKPISDETATDLSLLWDHVSGDHAAIVKGYQDYYNSVEFADNLAAPTRATALMEGYLDRLTTQVIPGMARETAKEVMTRHLPAVDGQRLDGTRLMVGDEEVGNVQYDKETGIPTLLLAPGLKGIRHSPSLQSGNPYDGVPEYADVSREFVDRTGRRGAGSKLGQDGMAMDDSTAEEITAQWKAQRWDAGTVSGLIDRWQQSNDSERAEIIKQLQPEAAIGDPDSPEDWRLNTRKLFQEGKVSLQEARLLEREFYGIQPGFKPLGQAWDEYKQGDSKHAEALRYAVDGGGRHVSSVRQKVEATTEAANHFLADYFKANGHRADFDLREYNQLRDSLADDEAGLGWWTAQIDHAVQNAGGSSAGILVGLGKFFTTTMSQEEWGMIQDGTSYASAGIGNSIADRMTLDVRKWWNGKEGGRLRENVDRLFDGIDNEDLTESEMEDIAREVLSAAVQVGRRDQLEGTEWGVAAQMEELGQYYDLSNMRSPLASLLLSYQATRDPSIKAQFLTTLFSTPEQQALQQKVASFSSLNGKIKENDFFGPLRLGFRGGQVAPIQETLIEVVSDLATAGTAKLLVSGAKSAKRVQEAGQAMNLVNRAALRMEAAGDYFKKLGIKEGSGHEWRNFLTNTAKTSAVGSVGEGFQEFAMAWAETGATMGDALVAGLQGMIGGPAVSMPAAGFMLGKMHMDHQAAIKLDNKQVSLWTDNWNKEHPATPLTEQDFRQLRNYIDPTVHQQQSEALQSAMRELEANGKAYREAASLGPVPPDVAQPILAARDEIMERAQLAAAAQKLSLLKAVSTLSEVNGIADPALRDFADAAVRAVQGGKLNPREEKALMGSTNEAGEILAEPAAGGGWRLTEAGLAALEDAAPATRKRYFPAEESQQAPSAVVQPAPQPAQAAQQPATQPPQATSPQQPAPVAPAQVDRKTQIQKRLAELEQEYGPQKKIVMDASGMPVGSKPVRALTLEESALLAEREQLEAAPQSPPPAPVAPTQPAPPASQSAAPAPQPQPAPVAPGPAPTPQIVPVTVTGPDGSTRQMQFEGIGSTPAEAAAAVMASPAVQALQRRGATVTPAAAAQQPAVQPAQPTPTPTPETTPDPAPVTPAQDPVMPAVDPQAAVAEAIEVKDATQQRETRVFKKLLEGLATMFGYKMVDSGIPSGFVDVWGKEHNFGTQLIDKMSPGSEIGQWIDKVGNASPEIVEHIRANMTAPYFHRVWFGHDPAANIGAVVDQFGWGAIPEYALQLAKDATTKSGIPLPGTQWLVQAGLVGDKTATNWLSLNVGEAFSGGLAILGSYKLARKAAKGENFSTGWALAGVGFKLVGGVIQTNPVLILSGLADATIVIMAKPAAVAAAAQVIAEAQQAVGQLSPEETPAAVESAPQPQPPTPQPRPTAPAQDNTGHASYPNLPTSQVEAILAATPATKLRGVEEQLAALDAAMEEYGGLFSDVVFDSKTVRISVGDGAVLKINLEDLLENYRGLPPKVMETVMRHEVIHAAVMAVMTPQEVENLWRSLPLPIQQRVYSAYFVGDILRKDMPKTMSEQWGRANSYIMGHEFIRQLVEDSEFQGEVTEAMIADPTLATKILHFLRNFVAQIRRMMQDMNPSHRAAVLEYERKVRNQVRQMLGKAPLPDPTMPAGVTRNTGARLQVLREWSHGQAPTASYWAGITDRGRVISIPGDVATTSWDARKRLAAIARKTNEWLAWDAGMVARNVTYTDPTQQADWATSTRQSKVLEKAFFGDPDTLELLEKMEREADNARYGWDAATPTRPQLEARRQLELAEGSQSRPSDRGLLSYASLGLVSLLPMPTVEQITTATKEKDAQGLHAMDTRMAATERQETLFDLPERRRTLTAKRDAARSQLKAVDAKEKAGRLTPEQAARARGRLTKILGSVEASMLASERVGGFGSPVPETPPPSVEPSTPAVEPTPPAAEETAPPATTPPKVKKPKDPKPEPTATPETPATPKTALLDEVRAAFAGLIDEDGGTSAPPSPPKKPRPPRKKPAPKVPASVPVAETPAAPAAETVADEETLGAVRAAFQGLFAPAAARPPAVIEQKSLPADRLPVFITLASKLVAEDVRTPAGLVDILNAAFGEHSPALSYAQALWDALSMVDLDLQGTHDWNALFGGRVPEEAAASPVDEAANEAATSPVNEKPEPTQAQKEAGNYAKGHVTIGGLDISIENPAGSERKGTDPNGKPWSVTMQSHYGYIRRSEGKDGDHIDIFIEPGTPEDFKGPVFVVNQMAPNGKFDEHKAIMGPSIQTEAQARAAYLANYAADWKGDGDIANYVSVAGFRLWALEQKQSKPAKTPKEDKQSVNPEQSSTPTKEKSAKQTPAKKIEDFGQKIGGARKDAWKSSGLNVSDLAGMTAEEREGYVKKATIWPEPPYAEWVEAGMMPEMALAIKQVRDALPTTGTQSQYLEIREKAQERFIQSLAGFRDAAPSMRTWEDFRRVFTAQLTNDDAFTYYPDYKSFITEGPYAQRAQFTKRRKALEKIISVIDILESKPDAYNSLTEEIKKTGWPAAQEPWRKKYAIRKFEAGSQMWTAADGRITLETDQYAVTAESKNRWKSGRLLADGFLTRQAAEEWAKEQYDKELGNRKKADKLTRPLNPDPRRDGPETRDGRDVTGEDFLAAFGFRGGEFGNWTNQADRQQALNFAYDSMHDLARVLGVSPKAISLNGQLGVAFGARGGGRFAAHYEPMKVVINLTRTNGAGSLAHEWAHAFDNYMFKLGESADKLKYMSGVDERYPSGIRQEVKTAYASLMEAVFKGPMDLRVALADAQAQVEKGRRSFRSWLSGIKEDLQPLVQMAVGEIPPMINGQMSTTHQALEMLIDKLPPPTDRTGAKRRADKLRQNFRFILSYADAAAAHQDRIDKGEVETTTKNTPTKFSKNAKALGEYWSRRHEMFARAFETYIQTRLNDIGQRNEYLVDGIKSNTDTEGTTDANRKLGWNDAYPSPREAARINEKFDALFQALQEETTDTGSVRLYSPAAARAPLEQKSLPADRLPAFIELAQTLIAKNIKTPDKMAQVLDEAFPGSTAARAYSQALWTALGMVDQSLRGIHDWQSIYQGIDSGDKVDVNVADESAPTPEPTVERGGTPDAGASVDASDSGGPQREPAADTPGDGAGLAEPSGIPDNQAPDGIQDSSSDEQGGTDGSGRDGDQIDAPTPGATGERGDAAPTAKPNGRFGIQQSGEAVEVTAGRDVEATQNLRIQEDDSVVPAGRVARIKANMAAIRLLRELGDQPATPEQKRVLAQYSGWGDTAQVFGITKINDYQTAADIVALGESGNYLYGSGKEKFDRWNKAYRPFYDELKTLLSPTEWEKAAESSLNAHYTSPEVIKALWDIAGHLGFQGGTALEPSAGIGSVMGLTPDRYAEKIHWTGIELDPTTASMLAKLYPRSDIQSSGFEVSKRTENNSQDLVVTNFPFGDYPVADSRHPDYDGWAIHDYFLARSVDVVKPGGLVIAITSRFTMDGKAKDGIRSYVGKKAELVGAFRLPNNAFKDNAGTEVVTDILIFRKRDGQSNLHGQRWTTTLPLTLTKEEKQNQQAADDLVLVPEQTGKKPSVDDIVVAENGTATLALNEYYHANPSHVLGRQALTGSMYGGNEYTVEGADTPIADLIKPLIAALPANIAGKGADIAAGGRTAIVTGAKTGTYVVNDKGQVMQSDGQGRAEVVDLPAAQRKKAAALIGIRDGVQKQLELENQDTATDEEVAAARAELNKLYDAYVKSNGALNEKENNVIDDDPEWPLVASLERDEDNLVVGEVKSGKNKGKPLYSLKKTWHKGPILLGRVNRPARPPASVGTVGEGVAVSMAYKGKIDLAWLSELTGQTLEELSQSLPEAKVAFENPDTGLWEASDVYLSGFVRAKLEAAQAAAEASPGKYEGNVAALEAVQPAKIALSDASFALGGTWIPASVLAAFAADTFGITASFQLVSTADSIQWEVTPGNGVSNALNASTWAGGGKAAIDLMADSLNLKMSQVTEVIEDDQGNKKTVVNPESTAAARQAQERIQKEFRRWGLENPTQAIKLEDAFDATYGGVITRETAVPDIQRFPGASENITLNYWQKRVVARAVQEGVLISHDVGTGKTFSLISIAMEMRRLGTANKPMVVVQNATLGQFAKSFKTLYPNARILVGNEKRTKGEHRAKFVAEAALGDWDAVIIPQSFFERLGNDTAREQAYVAARIAEVDDAIRAAEREVNPIFDPDGKAPAKSPTGKALMRVKKRLRAKLDRIIQRLEDKGDEMLTFEQTGVDALLVDEAHAFKRGDFFTKMDRIKGLDTQGSDRAMSFFLKTDFIHQRTPDRNVILATGTPISNTLAEMWTMARYVKPDFLAQMGMQQFDAFAGNFTRTTSTVMETPTGDFQEVLRLGRYTNGPVINHMWRSVADIYAMSREDLKGVPNVKGGGTRMVELERTPAVTRLTDFLKRWRGWYDASEGDVKAKYSWLALVQYLIARKAGVDMRLVDPDLADEPGSKTNAVVDEVFKIWQDTAENSSTQLVFSNLIQSHDPTKMFLDKDETIPNPLYGRPVFNLFAEIQAKLIAKGVPAEEMMDFSGLSNEKKTAMGALISSGKVRIAFGSTETLGTGLNVQEKIIAIHHIDPQFRPMDNEQRNGRGIRQGNENPVIEIIRYGMKGTMDSVLDSIVSEKAAGIAQAKQGKMGKEFEDPSDENVMNFQNMAAAFSGNPMLRQQFALKNELRQLEVSREDHAKRQSAARHEWDSATRRGQEFVGKRQETERALARLRRAFPDMKPTALEIKGEVFKEKELNEKLRALFEAEEQKLLERINTKFTDGTYLKQSVADVQGRTKGVNTEAQARAYNWYPIEESAVIDVKLNGQAVKVTLRATVRAESLKDNKLEIWDDGVKGVWSFQDTSLAMLDFHVESPWFNSMLVPNGTANTAIGLKNSIEYALKQKLDPSTESKLETAAADIARRAESYRVQAQSKWDGEFRLKEVEDKLKAVEDQLTDQGEQPVVAEQESLGDIAVAFPEIGWLTREGAFNDPRSEAAMAQVRAKRKEKASKTYHSRDSYGNLAEVKYIGPAAVATAHGRSLLLVKSIPAKGSSKRAAKSQFQVIDEIAGTLIKNGDTQAEALRGAESVLSGLTAEVFNALIMRQAQLYGITPRQAALDAVAAEDFAIGQRVVYQKSDGKTITPTAGKVMGIDPQAATLMVRNDNGTPENVLMRYTDTFEARHRPRPNLGAPAAARPGRSHYATAQTEATLQQQKASDVKRSTPLSRSLGSQRSQFSRDARNVWADFVQGNIDRIEHYAPGFTEIWLDTERNIALARAAVNDLFEVLNQRARKGFGHPSWWRTPAVWARWKRFQAELLPVAARLEVSGIDNSGAFTFQPFMLRAGQITATELAAQGAKEGDFIIVGKDRLFVGPPFSKKVPTASGRVRKVQYNVLMQPLSAEDQAATYREFVDSWADFPIAKDLLDDFIMPGMEKARFIGPRGAVTAEFNRYSLRDFFNEWPQELRDAYGELPYMESTAGYVPEVPLRSSTPGLVGLISQLLRTYSSPARRGEQGLRSFGDTKNLFQGFQAQLMQAHLEKMRMERRGRILKTTAKPVKDIPLGERDQWISVNDAFDHMYEAIKLAKNLDPNVFPSLAGALNPSQRDLMQNLVGEAWMLRGQNLAIPAVVYREMLQDVASLQTENLFLSLLGWMVQQFNAASLASLQYLGLNFVGNELMKLAFTAQKFFEGLVFSLHPNATERQKGRIAMETTAYMVKGLFTDRLALRRKKFREVMPQELFDTNHFFNAIDGMDIGVMDNLKRIQFGSAFLAAFRSNKWDVGAKVQMAYAMYQAHARAEWRDAVKADPSLKNLSAKDKKAWLRSYASRAPAELHREIEWGTGEWLMNYENTPRWMNSQAIKAYVDPTRKGTATQRVVIAQMQKLAIGLLVPFMRWSYLFARRLKRTVWDDGVKNLINRRGEGSRAQGLASLMGLGAMLAIPGMLAFIREDDDDEDTAAPLLGRSRDAEGKDLERNLRATNRINASALARITAAWAGFGEDLDFAIKDDAGQDNDLWVRYRNFPYIKEGIVAGLWLDSLTTPTPEQETSRITRPKTPVSGTSGIKDAFGQSAGGLISEYVALGLGYQVVADAMASAAGGYTSAGKAAGLKGLAIDFVLAPVIPHRLNRDIQSLIDPSDRRQSPSKSLDYAPGWKEALKARIPGLKNTLPMEGKMATPVILSSQTTLPASEVKGLMDHFDIPATALQYTKGAATRDIWGDLKKLKALGAGPQDVGLSTSTSGKPTIAYARPQDVRKKDRRIEAVRVSSPFNTLPINRTAYKQAIRGKRTED